MKEFTKPEYIPVFSEALHDENLQVQDCLVLGAIYWLERLKDGRCFASNKYIAEIVRSKNVVSISNSLSKLEENGYIRCVYKDEKKRNRVEIILLLKRLERRRDSSTDDTASHSEMSRESSTDEQKKKSKKKREVDISKTEVLQGKQWNALIDAFAPVNPLYEEFYKSKTERNALEVLAGKIGYEKLLATIQHLEEVTSRPYAPKITKPTELKRDIGKLVTFYKQNMSIFKIKNNAIAEIT